MKKITGVFLLFVNFCVTQAQEVKLMTYNIRLDHKGDGVDNWEYRKNELADFVLKEHPDFLGVQEAMANQHLFLKDQLRGYKVIGVGREDGVAAGEFSSLFFDESKWTCIKDSTFWLSETPSVVSKGWDASFHRVCTFGIFVDHAGDTIVVSNTHLDHQGVEARKNSVVLLKDHMTRYSQQFPSLLMGDFNFTPEDELHESMTQSLADVRAVSLDPVEIHKGTFNGFNLEGDFDRRIDYVYYERTQWFVESYQVPEIKSTRGRQLSDHFPVIVHMKSANAYQFAQYIHGLDTLNYRMLYPSNFDQNKKYPLVLFLHGRGEIGDENRKQLIHGGKLFLDSIEQYPSIVIAPQCRPGDYWASVNRTETNGRLNFEFLNTPKPNKSLGLVMELVEEKLAMPYVDRDRFYVTGLSMGGMGTWELLWRMSHQIAAALPICGGGLPEKANLMTDVPIWTFHGTKDSTVPIYHTIRMLESIQKAGGKLRASFYEGVGHNSWSNAFAEPNYLKWMFSKKLKK